MSACLSKFDAYVDKDMKEDLMYKRPVHPSQNARELFSGVPLVCMCVCVYGGRYLYIAITNKNSVSFVTKLVVTRV